MITEMQVKLKQIVKRTKYDSLGLEGNRGLLLLKMPEKQKQV